MNKQELIEKLKDWQSTAKEDKQGAVYMSMQIAIKLAEQLDEPSKEECEVAEVNEIDIKCSNCNHIFTDNTFTYDEEYIEPDEGGALKNEEQNQKSKKIC